MLLKEKNLFHRKEISTEYSNLIRGCLIGQAAGDALGYPVEYQTAEEIQAQFGENGIRDHLIDPETGKAHISSDTQMTMFTATGILEGDTRNSIYNRNTSIAICVAQAYNDWLLTQNETYKKIQDTRRKSEEMDTVFGKSWLLDIPEMFQVRCPGETSIKGSQDRVSRKWPEKFTETVLNSSKSCGGMVRVSPVALYYAEESMDESDIIAFEGAEIAAITHGHPIGCITAAMYAYIINTIIYHRGSSTLEDIIQQAREPVLMLYSGYKHIKEFNMVIQHAIDLSKNRKSDQENIREIGKGWDADQTLAIAIYCSLRHQDDFSEGIISAVNHDGNSDSTGSVTGSILGAWLGEKKIDPKWTENLELYDVISELSDDLVAGCPEEELPTAIPMEWKLKYTKMRHCQTMPCA